MISGLSCTARVSAWMLSVAPLGEISALARAGRHVVATSYDGTIYLLQPDLTVVRTLTAMRQKLNGIP